MSDDHYSFHSKKKLLAKQYLADRELQEREQQRRDTKLERSRAWLEAFLAQPRNSRLNWAPRWPITKDISNYAREKEIEQKRSCDSAMGESPQGKESQERERQDKSADERGHEASLRQAQDKGQRQDYKTFDTPF